MTRRTSALILARSVVTVAGIVHPAALVIGGACAGVGFVLAAVARRRSEVKSERLTVAEWLSVKAFSDETVGEVTDRLGGTALAEIARSHAAYHYGRGYDAATEDEHVRRCVAARRGAATRSRA